MIISVIGTGYVGLVAGTCLAETGNDVICVDIDKARLSRLAEGDIPIYEPGLAEMVRRNTEKGRLSFSDDTAGAVGKSLVVFLAVGTPPSEDGSADLQHVLKAAATAARGINGYRVIVNKSTVPAGTAAMVKETVARNTQHPFDVVSNPEFLKEGTAVEDFMKPDRIIIGSDSSRAKKIMDDLYAPFVRTGRPILHMCIESAELVKYASNAFLAVRISFINEIAHLCETINADVEDVRRGMGTDSRIGPAFLFPGMGFGGSCFPKDCRALACTGRENDVPLDIVNATISANRQSLDFVIRKITGYFKGELSNLHVAVWGLAFKANTDDVRQSPAMAAVSKLLEAGASISVYDPQAMETAAEELGDSVKYASDSYDALKDADALLIATEWNEFRRPDFSHMKNLMNQPVIFDGRNLFDPIVMKQGGFIYHGIGRKNAE